MSIDFVTGIAVGIGICFLMLIVAFWVVIIAMFQDGWFRKEGDETCPHQRLETNSNPQEGSPASGVTKEAKDL